MDGKDDRLQIRCHPHVAEQFRALALGYDSQGDALQALLDAHAQRRNNLKTVRFEPLGEDEDRL